MPRRGNVRAVGDNTAQIRYAQRKEEFAAWLHWLLKSPTSNRDRVSILAFFKSWLAETLREYGK
jgi:hypothetical protein